MDKTRVLHVVSGLYIGGVEQFLYSLLSKWDRQSYEVTICCLIERGPFAAEFEKLGIRVFSAGYEKDKKIRSLIRLRKLIREVQPDIIHCWCYGLHVLVVLATRLANVPAFITSIQGVQNYKGLANLRNKIIFAIASRFIDREVPHCKEVERSAESYVPRNRLTCIYNGVDTDRFHPGSIADRSRLLGFSLEPDTIVVSKISRLDRYKDHALFLRAAHIVSRKRPNVKFIIVGSGPTENSLKEIVSELKLNDLVYFLGTRLDTEEILRASDVFVFAATEEGGMSVCLMEAMASSIPVVVAGCWEAVEHGVEGYSFPVGSLNEVADAIDQLAQSRELRLRFGERARQRAEQMFSISNSVREYYKVYEEVLVKV